MDLVKGFFSGVARRFHAALAALRSARTMWLLAGISLATLVVVAWLNPAKVGAYVWIVSKLTLAAVLGYVCDRAAFPHGRPSRTEGIEQSLAYTRRATVIAATIIAAGLMP